MTVTVNQNFCACEATRGELGCAIGEPVGEQPGVLAQAFRAGIVGEKFQQLIFENAGATWFKEDEWQAGLDLRCHKAKHAGKIGAGSAEKAEVVEWAAAADVAARGFNLKAGFKKDGLGREERLRMVVVVPRIRPQQDWPSRQPRFALRSCAETSHFLAFLKSFSEPGAASGARGPHRRFA